MYPTWRRAAVAIIGAVSATCLVSPHGFAFYRPVRGRVVPNVEFGALVNGASSNPVIRMGCFGAVHPGQKGHPMGDQSVEIFRPEALRVTGFTGSTANEIVARFSEDPSVPIVLRRFGRPGPVPTSLFLPCAGSGSVVFTPEPSSASSQGVTVPVSYVGQP